MSGLKVSFLFDCMSNNINKIFKKIYFTSKNYNKSFKSKTPQQVYYSPNPFLLSIITSYKNQTFKISDIDPNFLD